jgi:hypothetical protein
MKMLMLVVATALAVCGCSRTRWIEIPPLLMNCTDLEDPNLKADLDSEDTFSLGRNMMQGVCAQSGAGSFTGDLRCENDRVKVGCAS